VARSRASRCTGSWAGRCGPRSPSPSTSASARGETSVEAIADYCLAMREAHGSTMFEGKLILGDPALEIETV
jgi:hypothetical protein